ncbi:MAG TPA: DUF4396 domain-containing protein [Gemmatimonadaceae bacterium]|nr:DUF4396 domain-containing protein [Gemmatimonadaceae bacterium]
MDLGFFTFLAQPWFVIAWYAIGVLAAAWVIYDEIMVNTPLNTAVKWAMPIIVVFFSVIGLALYWWACRPPHIGDKEGDEAKQAFEQYVKPTYKKVNGSIVHCVGGDGLGIVTAMIIARLVSLSFWQEFWFEYAAGFAFGWFIFQMKAMLSMTDSVPKALWMGGRAEFFSMITVMGGMGLIMGIVTPLAVGQQPKPDTAAFWGFAALGLLAGYIATIPTNWILVKMGWKHGLG